MNDEQQVTITFADKETAHFFEKVIANTVAAEEERKKTGGGVSSPPRNYPRTRDISLLPALGTRAVEGECTRGEYKSTCLYWRSAGWLPDGEGMCDHCTDIWKSHEDWIENGSEHSPRR
jgi:hypothetical protein